MKELQLLLFPFNTFYEQGGAWPAGGERETATGEVGDEEEAIPPPGLLHSPDAGEHWQCVGNGRVVAIGACKSIDVCFSSALPYAFIY